MAYDNKQIARELIATALGEAYCGNALYVAKDIPILTDEERYCIFRYLDGTACVSKIHSMDHVELQHIAHKIAADA
jgi:hypothetical protein